MVFLQQPLLLIVGLVLALFLHALHESPISPEPLLMPYSSFTPNHILQVNPPNLTCVPPLALFSHGGGSQIFEVCFFGWYVLDHQRVERLGEGSLPGPEDIAVDKDGTLYTATRDGWIKRMHRNGSWEDWQSTGCHTLLGVAISKAGGVLVCDVEKGLLRVSEEGVAVLTSQVDIHQSQPHIRFADEAVEASDGTVYFSDASDKFGPHDFYLEVLEARPHGRLLKYDPWKRTTSVVIDGLGFANGVALSAGEDFLVVCETWKFRCLRHWLKGEHKGMTEVFIDNLPGGPDNVNLAPDGSFWIALLQISHRRLRMLHRWSTLKRVIAAFPKLVKLLQPTNIPAMVVNVPADGRKVTRMFDDAEGKVMCFVTSAVEFEGHLYLGSLDANFIGRLSLEGLGY